MSFCTHARELGKLYVAHVVVVIPIGLVVFLTFTPVLLLHATPDFMHIYTTRGRNHLTLRLFGSAAALSSISLFSMLTIATNK